MQVADSKNGAILLGSGQFGYFSDIRPNVRLQYPLAAWMLELSIFAQMQLFRNLPKRYPPKFVAPIYQLSVLFFPEDNKVSYISQVYRQSEKP